MKRAKQTPRLFVIPEQRRVDGSAFGAPGDVYRAGLRVRLRVYAPRMPRAIAFRTMYAWARQQPLGVWL